MHLAGAARDKLCYSGNMAEAYSSVIGTPHNKREVAVAKYAFTW